MARTCGTPVVNQSLLVLSIVIKETVVEDPGVTKERMVTGIDVVALASTRVTALRFVVAFGGSRTTVVVVVVLGVGVALVGGSWLVGSCFVGVTRLAAFRKVTLAFGNTVVVVGAAGDEVVVLDGYGRDRSRATQESEGEYRRKGDETEQLGHDLIIKRKMS
jgi:hypothetical protein